MKQPALSVVVAAWNGPAALRACLASLRSQAGAGPIEVVVARNFEAAGALAELPGVVDLPMPSGSSVPTLRAAGLARSRGSIVAFIEDHCTCDPGWADALRQAHRDGHAAVGGPVAPDQGASLRDWAVYFYDYGRFMPPCAAGPVRELSGINMSYARAALSAVPAQTAGGVYEAELQGELSRQGYVGHLAPGAVVTHRGHRSAREDLGQAFRFARTYAARRVTSPGAARRLMLGLGALLLPALLGGRIVAAILRQRRHRITLLASLPWLGLLLAAWSAGEAAGYFTGRTSGSF